MLADCEEVYAGYLGSMAGTLYAALALHSCILSLVCCAAQVSCIRASAAVSTDSVTHGAGTPKAVLLG